VNHVQFVTTIIVTVLWCTFGRVKKVV